MSLDGSTLDDTAAATQPSGLPDALRVGSVALAVRDLAGTEAFYRRVLGLQVTGRGDAAIHLGVGGRTLLELLHRPDALPDDPAAAGLFHTAFLLPSRADLGRWLAHAAAIRQPLDGAADHLVSEAVYLHDPEGNGIEVYADRPRGQWRWTEGADGRRIQMANSPLDRDGLLGLATTPWTGAPDGTCVGHVHLRVGDAREAVRFYGGVLGLDLTATRPSAAFLSSSGYHHHVAANTWHSPGAGPRDPGRAGLAAVTLVARDAQVLAGIARRSHVPELPAGLPDHLPDPWGTVLRFQIA